MRKQLVIGLSVLALSGLGSAKANNVSVVSQARSQQYPSLIETSLKQSFEPKSRASLILGLPDRFSYQAASIYFITKKQNLSFGDLSFDDTSIEQCKSLGYNQVSCPSGQISGSACPYNPSYFDKCCDARYKYDKSSCVYPNTLSGDSCGGKYMCYCDKSLYSITQCPSPQVPTGEGCTEEGVTYYSQCSCPDEYSQTCDGQNQEGVGEGCTENGVTKYTACQCKDGYNMTCSDLGPITPTDYCLKDNIKYYNNCKTCENKCTLDKCPTGVVCTYEECSQKYCAVGCAVGYKDLDNYWCNGAMRCWFK